MRRMIARGLLAVLCIAGVSSTIAQAGVLHKTAHKSHRTAETAVGTSKATTSSVVHGTEWGVKDTLHGHPLHGASATAHGATNGVKDVVHGTGRMVKHIL